VRTLPFSQIADGHRMLYEFHHLQNAKKPGTVHATYLISGTKRAEEQEASSGVQKDGEDAYMQSSPFMSSSMPQPDQDTGETSVLSISLVREEDLESMTYLPFHPTPIVKLVVQV
jgi:DNA polymerase delta subunit 3